MAAAPLGLRDIGTGILDWVLPPRCAGCGIIVGSDAGFCPACWQQLDFLGPPACSRCDRPFQQAQGDGALCGSCLADPPQWDRGQAALRYGPLPRRVVLRLKYGRRLTLARLAAQLMLPKLPVREPDGAPWLLVPVPLHRWRLWQRGFNQSVALARELARHSGFVVLPDALVRTRATPPLRGLGRKDRAAAVRGAFTAHPRREMLLAGARILLIDDVWTSGATAAACTRALRKAGAVEVQLLTFARVLTDDEGQWAAIDTGPTATDMQGP